MKIDLTEWRQLSGLFEAMPPRRLDESFEVFAGKEVSSERVSDKAAEKLRPSKRELLLHTSRRRLPYELVRTDRLYHQQFGSSTSRSEWSDILGDLLNVKASPQDREAILEMDEILSGGYAFQEYEMEDFIAQPWVSKVYDALTKYRKWVERAYAEYLKERGQKAERRLPLKSFLHTWDAYIKLLKPIHKDPQAFMYFSV